MNKVTREFKQVQNVMANRRKLKKLQSKSYINTLLTFKPNKTI